MPWLHFFFNPELKNSSRRSIQETIPNKGNCRQLASLLSQIHYLNAKTSITSIVEITLVDHDGIIYVVGSSSEEMRAANNYH